MYIGEFQNIIISRFKEIIMFDYNIDLKVNYELCYIIKFMYNSNI